MFWRECKSEKPEKKKRTHREREAGAGCPLARKKISRDSWSITLEMKGWVGGTGFCWRGLPRNSRNKSRNERWKASGAGALGAMDHPGVLLQQKNGPVVGGGPGRRGYGAIRRCWKSVGKTLWRFVDRERFFS